MPLATAELYHPATLTPAGLVSISVNPQNPTLIIGGTQQFLATGTFSNNSTQTLQAVTWSSSDTSVATLSNDASNYGNALALAPGTASVSACAGTTCGSTTLTVTPPSPIITSLYPASGVVGTPVTITGTNFGSTQGSSTVTFNGLTATPSSWSDTSITVPVPAGAATGNVVVTTAIGASTGTNYVINPHITNVNPTISVAGGQVTITGTTFGATAGTVYLGNYPGIIVSWTDTQVVATVHRAAGSGSAYVVTQGGAVSNQVLFTIIVPHLDSISPTAAPVGQPVTFTGSNFGPAPGTVTLGSYSGNIVSWSDTQVVATVHAISQSGIAEVITQGGGVSNQLPFTVLATPQISTLSPDAGPAATVVTITGTGFGSTQGSSTVTFKGIAASPSSWSDTSISVPVPAGATTGYVVVTANGAASNRVLFRAPSSNFTLTAGSLGTARWAPLLTLLQNGQVLVAGGVDGNWNGLSGEELYDPTTQTFTATAGNLHTVRAFATATLLNNGQVLIAGGFGRSWDALATAEIYDPAQKTFTLLPAHLNTARGSHTAILLPDGKVLLAGGYDLNTLALSSAEIYDPVAQTFTTLAGQLKSARAYATATLLPNGLVLLAGGLDDNWTGVASADLYNPADQSFTTPTGNLQTARGWAAATLLNNGQVLITGGFAGSGDVLATAELYDPAGKTFTAAPQALTVPRAAHTATLLDNGQVLILGGWNQGGWGFDGLQGGSAELYDPATGAFTPEGSMSYLRIGPAALRLLNGQVLVVGGEEDVPLATAELYHPATLTPAGLVSISVTPQNPTLIIGGTQQFLATGTFSNNSTQTLQAVTWSSSDTSVATLSNDASNSGKALALAPGTASVSACAGTTCGSTTLTVTPPSPIITSLYPASGVVGTPVTITGTNFGSTQGSSTVTFNGLTATPSTWSDTSITVPVPAGATTGNVVVTTRSAPAREPTT